MEVGEMTLALALLLTQAAPVVGLKPWEKGSIYGPADRAVMEKRFQVVRDAPPYRLAGLPRYDRAAMSDELLLGDLLFHAPLLLGPRAAWFGLSCSTCHPGGATHNTLFVEAQSDRPGNVDLLSDYFYAEADDRVFAPRNISSLRGCAHSGPYRRDGTVDRLEAANALVVRHEFQQVVPEAWQQALDAYVQRFELWPGRFVTPEGSLTPDAPALARAGEAVFDAPREGLEMKSCSSCHVKVRNFADGKTHALRHGEGRGTLGKTVSFDTPTLLDTVETAPYFFDGSATDFAAAVGQLDRRHGLKLSSGDRLALTAYLEAVGAVSEPRVTWPPAERVRQALAWGRLADTADAALWPVLLDAMRLQVRLAGDTPELVRLARELEALGGGGPTPKARARLRELVVGHGADRRE